MGCQYGNISGYIITKVLIGNYIGDELQLLIIGTNCRFFELGRIDAWDELSLFGIWDELSLGTNLRLGRIVALRHRTYWRKLTAEKQLHRLFLPLVIGFFLGMSESEGSKTCPFLETFPGMSHRLGSWDSWQDPRKLSSILEVQRRY